MAQTKALTPAVFAHISKLLSLPLRGVLSVVELLDEGATVPFIARYRKEATSNLDEVRIREVQEKLEYFRELEERRETVLAILRQRFAALDMNSIAVDRLALFKQSDPGSQFRVLQQYSLARA